MILSNSVCPVCPVCPVLYTMPLKVSPIRHNLSKFASSHNHEYQATSFDRFYNNMWWGWGEGKSAPVSSHHPQFNASLPPLFPPLQHLGQLWNTNTLLFLFGAIQVILILVLGNIILFCLQKTQNRHRQDESIYCQLDFKSQELLAVLSFLLPAQSFII